MPRLLKDFPVTEPGSLGTYSVDFSSEIPPGATVAAVVWSLAIHAVQPGATIDSAPQSRLIDEPQIIGAITLQAIGNLLPDVDYLVAVTATASDGEIVTLWCVLPCRAPQ